LLLMLAEPIALRLPPVSALCLLTGSGWLVYLMIRGDPAPSRRLPSAKVDGALIDVVTS
jgi:hypothetical protein